MSLLHDATLIVSERQQAYHEIVADMYFMALISNDHDEAAEIWREAQLVDSFFLSSALASARQLASSLAHPPRITWRSTSRTRRRLPFEPTRRSHRPS